MTDHTTLSTDKESPSHTRPYHTQIRVAHLSGLHGVLKPSKCPDHFSIASEEVAGGVGSFAF
jgi:hypothetical protein